MKNIVIKNRRGFLLGEETLKIVIAVIGIIFLVALLASLYFALTDSQKVKEAQASANNILSNEITRISNGGEINQNGILIPNPSGWHIFSFTEDKKPNLCSGEKCACICGKVLVDLFDAQIKECDKKGSCIIVPNLKNFDKIKIEKNGTFVLVQQVNSEIEIRKK